MAIVETIRPPAPSSGWMVSVFALPGPGDDEEPRGIAAQALGRGDGEHDVEHLDVEGVTEPLAEDRMHVGQRRRAHVSREVGHAGGHPCAR